MGLGSLKSVEDCENMSGHAGNIKAIKYTNGQNARK